MPGAISHSLTHPTTRTEPTRLAEPPRSHWRWATPAPAPARAEDTVELSHHAQWMQNLAKLPPGRLDVVNRVRAQIACGSYETERKIEVAAERLAHDVLANA